jgi:hypothetical protein
MAKEQKESDKLTTVIYMTTQYNTPYLSLFNHIKKATNKWLFNFISYLLHIKNTSPRLNC